MKVAPEHGDMKMLRFLGSALMVITFLVVLSIAGIALLMVDLEFPSNLIAGGLWFFLLAIAALAAAGLVRGGR